MTSMTQNGFVVVGGIDTRKDLPVAAVVDGGYWTPRSSPPPGGVSGAPAVTP